MKPSLVALILLLVELGLVCGRITRDQFIRKEVDDFEEFLQKKAAGDPSMDTDSFSEGNKVFNSEEDYNFPKDNVPDKQEPVADFGSVLENFAASGSDVKKHPHHLKLETSVNVKHEENPHSLAQETLVQVKTERHPHSRLQVENHSLAQETSARVKAEEHTDSFIHGNFVREKGKEHRHIFHKTSIAETTNPEHNSENKPMISGIRHGVKEILLVRVSNSESNDPFPDIMDKLVHDLQEKETATGPEDSYVEEPNPEDPAKKKAAETDVLDAEKLSKTENLPKDQTVSEDSKKSNRCSANTIPADSEKVCNNGLEYEMEFHPNYTEFLNHSMAGMLHLTIPDVSKCDYHQNLGTDKGVEDRALCPFKWTIGKHNPSRIPEFLFEAKCSCQRSRSIRGKMLECVPIKQFISVMWKTCHDGKIKQQVGWEAVNVACGPIEVRNAIESPEVIGLTR